MAIAVAGLVKHYGDVVAVAGIDLHVSAGEVFALLGPNGAGKSTTVEILEGHRPRTAGAVSVLGYDPELAGRDFRERIGIVLQDTAVESALTVRETVELYGAMYPRSLPADVAIEIVGLEEKASARVKHLSGGQRRRLELALGIVGDPDLLFLDEPTTGFDPSARRQAWTVIGNLRSLGKTIVLTTHYMDEAQSLADRVAVIARGRIVASGTPEAIRGRNSAKTRVAFGLPVGVMESDLPDLIRAGARVVGDQVELLTSAPAATLHTLTGWALERGLRLDSLEVHQQTLEEVYLELVGGEGDGDAG